MATDSNIRLTAPQNIQRRKNALNLRAPGWFAKWPAVGWMMFVVGMLVFGGMAYSVTTQKVPPWDSALATMFQAQFKQVPASLVEYVVFGFYLGRELILVCAIILGAYFWHKRYWRELMMVLWGPGLGGLLWFVLSSYFDRPRPPVQLDVLALSVPSFPSGHVMSAVLFYGLLGYLLVPRMPSRFWKWFVVIVLTVIIVFIGWSRLLVGGHYFSDVIAGYALGIAWAGLVYPLAERLVPKERGADESESTIADEASSGLRASGLFHERPLLGGALILLGSLSFAALGADLLQHGFLTQLDQSFYEALITSARAASPNVNEIMTFGFFVGKQVIFLIVTFLSIYFIYQRFWRELAMLWISSAGGSLVWDFFVNYFNRPRPAEQTGLEVRTIPSFPSGHAMSAIICYGFLAYLLIPKMPSRAWKWIVAIAALLIILFGGYSRIYQGSHYLTDVLAGYALGIAWAALVYTLIEVIFIKRKV